jgi:hypothetical protein
MQLFSYWFCSLIAHDGGGRCHCCYKVLQQYIKKRYYLIGAKCRFCTHFTPKLGKSWRDYYPEGCICEYGEEDYCAMTCAFCKCENSDGTLICIRCCSIKKKLQ